MKMTKRKSTKRALLFSALSLLLCVSMLVGTTFAWFTDSVTSGKNTIASGNLDVQLFYAETAADVAAEKWTEVDGNTDTFGYNNWEPGYTKVVYFKVKNNGSLALKYQLSAVIDKETAGVNKDGNTFYLSNYIKCAVVDTSATRNSILALNGSSFKTGIALSDGDRHLTAGASEVIGMALWMPTSVDNVANHNGTDIPSIEFGIHLIATQDTVESDSFDKYYDANAKYPNTNTNNAPNSYGSVPTDPDTGVYEFDLLNDENGKTGFVRIFSDSVDPDAKNVSGMVTPAILDTSVPVTDSQNAKSFNITVTGVKEGNTTPVEVWFNAGAGLSNVTLYHNNEVVENATYDAQTGNVRFESTDFSPYTVVYDEAPEVTPDTEVPVAQVTEIKPVETIDKWETYGGLCPNDPAQQLEAMFNFAAPHNSSTVDDCKYKDWYCDFYVMMDRDVPDGAICLGGNYGTWGWIGFNNIGMPVPANTPIPLLSTATSSEISGWKYSDVVGFVEVFKCGVARSNGTDLSVLEGATFSVMLRIVNPENTEEYIDVNTVEYTFGSEFGKGTTVIKNYGE